MELLGQLYSSILDASTDRFSIAIGAQAVELAPLKHGFGESFGPKLQFRV